MIDPWTQALAAGVGVLLAALVGTGVYLAYRRPR